MEEKAGARIRGMRAMIADEARLLEGLRAKETWAQEALYEAYRGRLIRTAGHFLGWQDPEAEDLAHETFIIAMQRIHQFKPRRGIYSWLNRICVHLCFKRLRQRQRVVATQHDELEALAGGQAKPQGDEALAQEKLLAMLREQMQNLGARCREIVELRDRQGLHYAAIARRLKLPMGTVFSRLARCRAALKSLVLAAGGRGS